MAKYTIGVDLGGTKIHTALADCKGKIINEVTLPTEAVKGPRWVIGNIKRSIHQIANHYRAQIGCIGIGAPGEVLFTKGIVVSSPNLPGFENIPLKKMIQDEFHKTVILDNDANAAALGELRFGSGRGRKNFVYVTISTGIGGGIVIDGKLYRGASGVVGEIGHTIIKEGGPKCSCGRNGCLEALGSGTAIARRFRGKPAQEVYELAKKGNAQAKKIISETGYFIGIGMANLINLLSPEIIIIGGGVTNMGDMLFNPIRETVKKVAFSVPGKAVTIIPSKLGNRVGVLGAIALAIEYCKE